MGTLRDRKYGPIEIPGPAEEGEPCFVLRGKDALAVMAIDAYARLVHAAALAAPTIDAPDLHRHSVAVTDAADEMRRWQSGHDTGLPD